MRTQPINDERGSLSTTRIINGSTEPVRGKRPLPCTRLDSVAGLIRVTRLIRIFRGGPFVRTGGEANQKRRCLSGICDLRGGVSIQRTRAYDISRHSPRDGSHDFRDLLWIPKRLLRGRTLYRGDSRVSKLVAVPSYGISHAGGTRKCGFKLSH